MIAPWAIEEVGASNLGDARLDERLVVLLSDLGSRPNLSIPAACGGRAETKAAYRFFDNDKTTFEKVIEPHIANSKARMAQQELVLLVQDTSEIDVTRPEQEVEGAGELDGPRRGVLLHEMLAFTPDRIPLGTVWAELLNRTEGVSHAPAAEKSASGSSRPSKKRRACVGLPPCGKHGISPRSCQESSASALLTVRPTSMKSSWNRVVKYLYIG